MKPKALILGILVYSASFPVLAAPFCTVFSWGKQCLYYDYQSCAQAAGTVGTCIANQEEIHKPSGSGKFCVVTSYATQCLYYDAESCRQVAADSGGVCMVKTR